MSVFGIYFSPLQANSANSQAISECQSISQRIVAIGDIHGDYNALRSIISYSQALEGTTLVTTGDTIDRGDFTIEVLDFFMNSNTSIHLLGNHEQLNLLNMYQYVSPGDFQSFGGEEQRKKAFNRGGKYWEYIKTREIARKIGDVIFVHAGISLEVAMKYNSVEEINEKFWKSADLYGNSGPVWYRGYAKGEKRACDELMQVLEIMGARFMVMGHTPFQRVTSLCSGMAIFIDTGISYAMMDNPSALEIIQELGVTKSIKALYPQQAVDIYNHIL